MNPRAEGFLVGRDVLRLCRGRDPRRARLFARHGRQMGPGYFPLLLGGVLGAARRAAGRRGRSCSTASRCRGSTSCRLRSSRSAVCLFGVLIEPLGLVISLAVLIVLSAWAGPQFRLARDRWRSRWR